MADTPVWIDEADALAVHARVLALHGGAAGVRDRGLLQSALARPKHHYTYAADMGVIHLAAVYTAGIVRNHPFIDGNKRTGFVLGVLFLELNGCRFEAGESEAADAVIALASGSLDDDGYAAFLAENVREKGEAIPSPGSA